MDITYLLDRLETVLSSGSRIPLMGKSMVDEHECLEIVDQLRVVIPEEIKQAKRLLHEKDRLLGDAEEQAKRIVSHAQEQVVLLSAQHEIAKAAEARARRILETAEAEAEERQEGSDRYVAEALSDLEDRLSELLSVVRNGLRSLDKPDRRPPARDAVRDDSPRV